MSRCLCGLLLICRCLFWAASARAGDAGAGRQPGGPEPLLPPPPGVILNLLSQHAADLKLTDEQKKKLEEIRKEFPPPAENAAGPDQEIRDLVKKFQDARKSGDKETAQALRKQIAEKFKELHPKAAKVIEAIKAVLNADQLAKLRELLREGRGQRAAQKAAAGADAQSPFDL